MMKTISTPRQTVQSTRPESSHFLRMQKALGRIREAHQSLRDQNAALLSIVTAYQSLYGPLPSEEKPPQQKDCSALAGSFLLVG